MVLDAAFLSNNNFLLLNMIIVEILIFYIRKLGEKNITKKKQIYQPAQRIIDTG